MARLTTAQRVWIVEHLACYDTPSEVVAGLKLHFGVTVSIQQVAGYDPTRVTGAKGLAQKWKDLFVERRKAFLANSDAIPTARKAYRLREYQKAIEAAKQQKNYSLVKELLIAAGKEAGGLFTNRRVVSAAEEFVEAMKSAFNVLPHLSDQQRTRVQEMLTNHDDEARP